ncbi:MAG: nucleotidyltransferase domain-containing protein [Anaerolineales bacterium]|nr:nucleotidyltransferase domain-containing protein [Anaerolineales bacterium]
MADTAIINTIKKYLKGLVQQGVPVQYAVLFGSQAGHEANEWSDIDLLVVSPIFDGERQRADINLLWRTAARTDSRIEPIPIGLVQYENGKGNPIVEVARREGEVVGL